MFIRRIGSYLLFASSVDVLVEAVGGQLHVDEAAWAEILAGGMVMGDRTPFEEIRRLRPGAWCRFTDGGVISDAPVIAFPPGTARPGDRTTALELIERMGSVVKRTQGDSITVPLSGGWDSRFLAALAAGSGRDAWTVTASDEFGRDDEAEWAAQVASRLRLPNNQLPPPGDWWEAVVASAAAQDFLTSKNHWLLPLAHRVAELPGTLLDGLAGDVLVKMNLPAWMSEATGRRIVDGMRMRFAPALAPAEMLEPATGSHLDDLVGQRFDACWTDVEDHPAALHLYNYYLRTPTGVGLSPTMLLSPSAPLVLPFVAQEVMDFALTVDPRDKQGGRWYQEVMAQLPNGMDKIPSSNDTRGVRRTQRRADQAPHVLQHTINALQHDSVRSVAGPRLRAAMASGSLLNARHVREQRVVRGLVVYSLWAQRYEHRLANPHFPVVTQADRKSRPRVSSYHVAQPTNAPADQRWLAAQDVPPSATFMLVDPHHGQTPRRVDTDPPLQRLRTASIVGQPVGFGQLESTIDAASSLLEPGGRLILSVALPDGPPGSSALGLMGTCELLSLKLDLVYVESSANRLRVIGKVADKDNFPAPVAPELLATAVGGLEKRVGFLIGEVTRLQHENSAIDADLAHLQREHETTVSARDARSGLEALVEDPAASHRASKQVQDRRTWRLADAVGGAKRAFRSALRLAAKILRIMAGER